MMTQKMDQEKEIEIKIENKQIKFEKEVKFLGLIFDQKLTWNQYTKYVIGKCKKRINLFRALSRKDWGTNKNIGHVMLYRTSTDSLNYRLWLLCIWQCNDTNNKAMESNTVESSDNLLRRDGQHSSHSSTDRMRGETSLELRRKELQLQYATKLMASENNPTESILDDCWQNYHHYPSEKTLFRSKTKNILEIIGESDIIEQNSYPTNPLWMPHTIHVDKSLSLSISKRETPTEIAKQLTERKIAEYSNTGTIIFNDASKTKTTNYESHIIFHHNRSMNNSNQQPMFQSSLPKPSRSTKPYSIWVNMERKVTSRSSLTVSM